MPVKPTSSIQFGWIVVAVLFLCTAALLGTAIYGFIMIADSMARARDWGETAAGGLVSAMWLVAPLALFCAPVIARFGPWKLIIAGLWALSAAFATLAFAEQFWVVYGLRVFMGLGKVAIMVSVPVVVMHWFDHKFGTAIAIIWAGGSAGGIVVAPLVENLDRTAGPQFATLALSAGIGSVALIAMATARAERRRLTSHAKQVVEETAKPDPTATVDLERRPRLAVIAGIVVATAALGCANVAFLALNPQIFARFGIDTATIAMIVGINAAAATVGALAIGWVTDRFGTMWPGVAIGLIYLCAMVSYFSLTAAPAVGLAMFAALLGGIGGGAAEVLWMALMRREASGTHFATVYGAWYFAIQIGYAAGGLIGGVILADLGYTSFIVIAALAFAATPLFSIWQSARKLGGVAPEDSLTT